MQPINYEPLKELEKPEDIARAEQYLQLDPAVARKRTSQTMFKVVAIIVVGFLGILLLGLLGIVILIAGAIWLFVIGSKQTKRRNAAVDAFVRLNGWSQANSATDLTETPFTTDIPGYRGYLRSQITRGNLGTTAFWLYGYVNERHAGKTTDVRNAQVLSLRLSEPLPRMILDASIDGSLKTAEVAAQNGLMKVDLEGNFPDTFAFYMESGNQADALTILSPELMEFLIKTGSFMNVEITGNFVHLVNRIAPLTMYPYTKYLFDFAELFIARLIQKQTTFTPTERD